MSPLLPGLLAAVSFGLAFAGALLVRDRGLAWRFDADVAAQGDERRSTGPLGRLLDALGRRLAGPVLRTMSPPARRRVRRRLEAAGRPGGMTVEAFAGRKGAFAVLFSVPALGLLVAGAWYSALPLAILGWIWVDLWVDGTARRRQARIERDLPDFLDVLAVCVSAGIAFRPAMARVAEATGGPLGEEVMLTLRQMGLGAPRREAFEDLRERNPSEFVGTFVSAFLQAEELGVPFADALVDLAADMRRAAYQRARRRAQRAAPRVSLIVTTLIMPGAMLLILAGMLLGSNIDVRGLFGGD